MSTHLSGYPSVHPSMCVVIYLSSHHPFMHSPSIHSVIPSVQPPIHPYSSVQHPPIITYPFFYPSIHSPIWPSIQLPSIIYPFIHTFIHLSIIELSIHASIHPSSDRSPIHSFLYPPSIIHCLTIHPCIHHLLPSHRPIHLSITHPFTHLLTRPPKRLFAH